MQVLYLSLAASAVAWLVTREELFAPLRRGLGRWLERHRSVFWYTASYPLACPVCMCYWSAAALCIAFDTGSLPVVLAWLVVGRLAQWELHGLDYLRSLIAKAQPRPSKKQKRA